MLVLTRRPNERIRVQVPAGNGTVTVWISVVELIGGKARIGVDAPPNVRVDREEIALAKEAGR